MSMFFGYGGRRWISSDLANAQRIASTDERASRLERRIEGLESHLERQALACQALWELLQQHVPLGEKDLLKKMEQIDLRDGVVDGRITPATPMTCPSCSRPAGRKRRRCLYCDADLGGSPAPFETP